jgi:hypothetical protein
MLWVLCAVAAVGLAVGSVLLGTGFLPGFGEAQKSGTIIPLFVAWALIATAVVSALTLAKFLLSHRSRT